MQLLRAGKRQRLVTTRAVRGIIVYHASRTIDEFSATLRGELDLDTFSAHLVQVADETLEPARVSLGLRPATPTNLEEGRS
jgi:hypothetical protein